MLIRRVIPLFILLFTQSLIAQEVKLGIVTDFEQGAQLDSVIRLVTSEINQTTGSGTSVTLPIGNLSFGNQQLTQAANAYAQMVSRADLIVLIGSVSIKGALTNTSLDKPTFGLGIINPELQNIPITSEGTSGIDNFTYVWPRDNFEQEIAAFKEVYNFSSLALVIDSYAQVTFDVSGAQQALSNLEQTYNTKINIIALDQDVNSALDNLPEGTDAVYLSALYSKTPVDIKSISNQLKASKIPSFSGDKLHVDNGILASLSKANLLDQTIVKLSIMADEALRGRSMADMKVKLEYDREFFLNIQTANEINFSPSFELLFTANLIGENDAVLPTYSLMEVMDKSLQNNFDVKISYQDIDLANQDIRLAKSSMLPTVDLSVSGLLLDPDVANNFNPERTTSGQLGLTQVIYSEEAIAGIKVSQFVKKAQEYNTEATVLSVLLDTYLAYFDVLAAKTNVVITQENLSNSKTNLELAKIKADLGSSSNADLYRWESEVASAKQALVEARTGLLSAKFRLNTFLANTLEDEFDIEDVTFGDEVFERFSQSPISQFVKTPQDLELISDFLIEEAITQNPNKKLLLENIKAIERQRKQNQRLFYAPTIALQASTTQNFGRGGVGSVEVPGFEFTNNNWQAGVSLSLPIFQGFARKANLQRSTIQLQQLNQSRIQLDQNLELQVRTSLLQLLNSNTNIGFSKIAADNAQLNFELVQQNYKQGLVNITQLIDAQRATIQAQLAYTLSIYDYTQAQLQVEFVQGFFSMFITEEQRTAFENRFLEFRNNR